MNAEAQRQHEAHKAVRERLMGRGKAVNIIEDLRRASEIEEVNKARQRREAEMRVARYRRIQAESAARRKKAIDEARQRRAVEREERKFEREAIAAAKKNAREKLASMPTLDDIRPSLTGLSTMADIAERVMSFFPDVIWEEILIIDRSMHLLHIRRIVATAIKENIPTVSYPMIGMFMNRHHTSVFTLIHRVRSAQPLTRYVSMRPNRVKEEFGL